MHLLNSLSEKNVTNTLLPGRLFEVTLMADISSSIDILFFGSKWKHLKTCSNISNGIQGGHSGTTPYTSTYNENKIISIYLEDKFASLILALLKLHCIMTYIKNL